ncbi:ArfGap/RecO-like zinc finger domain-containing protein [Dorcoceras hygrometricum]|uniref:ArfGap/RecO-like zinc finger domain-containing protein n=1 Tax=Dorcoceras hygrometricum TaxID=472368 RepID=A0A2Z7ADZ6_9LAMI|nr:ArfGap/RecO-like zinc finger domain-containing protein [Dorcoceras hygrometricum]
MSPLLPFQEGFTRRFDGYRPSANTQSPSLAQACVAANFGERCRLDEVWIVEIGARVQRFCFAIPDVNAGQRNCSGATLRPADRVVMPEKSNAIIGVVTIGFECLPPSCDGLTDPDDHGPMISTGRFDVRGSSGNQAGQSGGSADRSPFP